MKKNSSTIIAVAIGVVLIALLVILMSDKKERYDWNPSFEQTGINPYDLNLFYNTIKSSYSESDYHIIKNLYTDTSFLAAQNGLVLAVLPYFQLDSIELSKLLKSAENGNKVFISSIKPAPILEYLRPNCFSDNESPLKERRGKIIKPSVVDKPSKPSVTYTIRQEKQRFAWTYLDFENCQDASKETLGSFESIGEDFINFVKLEYGQGAIYLHTTPLIFTNFHFKNEDVFKHTQEIFSKLPHQKLYYLAPEYGKPSGGDRPLVSESPLRFVLANPPLKWAWYLIITLTILYVFNAVRRRQKSIPVFALPENETASYLDVVSRLYEKEGHHKDIIGVQERLLKRHLRNKYRINMNSSGANVYEEAATRLQMQSGYLKQTFTDLDRAKNNSTLSDEELKTIIQKIKEFYKKCP